VRVAQLTHAILLDFITLIVFAEKYKVWSFFFNFYSRHPIAVICLKTDLQDSWIKHNSKICINNKLLSIIIVYVS
jgi:hypothetical protein